MAIAFVDNPHPKKTNSTSSGKSANSQPRKKSAPRKKKVPTQPSSQPSQETALFTDDQGELHGMGAIFEEDLVEPKEEN